MTTEKEFTMLDLELQYCRGYKLAMEDVLRDIERGFGLARLTEVIRTSIASADQTMGFLSGKYENGEGQTITDSNSTTEPRNNG